MILNTTYEGEMGEEYPLRVEFDFKNNEVIIEWVDIERPDISGDLVWDDFFDEVMIDEKLEARLEAECKAYYEAEKEEDLMAIDAAYMACDEEEAHHDAEMSRDTGANEGRHY